MYDLGEKTLYKVWKRFKLRWPFELRPIILPALTEIRTHEKSHRGTSRPAQMVISRVLTAISNG